MERIKWSSKSVLSAVLGVCVVVFVMWVGSYLAMRKYAQGGIVFISGEVHIDYGVVGPCARVLLWAHEPLIRLDAGWRDENVYCTVEGRLRMYGRLRNKG